MKVAFAGDWHANTDWATSTIRRIAEDDADAIVHLGDFGYDFDPTFVHNVNAELRNAGLELWFVDGNHENFNRLTTKWPVKDDGRRRLDTNLYHLPRGFRWTWDGVRFLAAGGAYSIDRKWRVPHVSWWPQEEITDEDVAYAIEGGRVDVLVSHDCPSGVDIPGLDDTAHLWPPIDLMRADAHRRQLRAITDVVQPRHVWHGHYHHRYNATADLGYGPVRVDGLAEDGTSHETNVAIVDLEQYHEGGHRDE